MTVEDRYSPDIAEDKYQQNLRDKGPDLKIGKDHRLAEYIEEKIAEDGYSPGAVLGEIKAKGLEFETEISKPTLYSYIDKGIFLTITNKELPVKGRRKKKNKKVRRQARANAGTSIEKRPEDIDTREEFGHWEMDSVESCQGVSNTYIVMTERKTRWELIIPSPDKTAASVVAAIDGLEAKYGDLFPKVFRSITCDNGCEFADAAGIERSASGKGARTEVYYCHPYRPSERGSNENQNGLIRRHVPKGTDLSTISDEETKRIEAWLNNYPRKMFGYLCSEQLFREEMALILAS